MNRRGRSFLWAARCRAAQATYPGLWRVEPIRGRIASPLVPYLVLLRVGFALPPPLLTARCALTAPFHPCCRTEMRRRYVFCGTFRDQPLTAGPRTLSGTLLFGVRTFLPAHLVTNGATVRPACLLFYYRCLAEAADAAAFRAPSPSLARALPAFRFASCRATYNRASGADLCRPIRELTWRRERTSPHLQKRQMWATRPSVPG
jgi:hypothetical protein